MKTIIVIFCAALMTIGLTSFDFFNPTIQSGQKFCSQEIVEKKIKEPKLPFFYNYGTRFSGITKTEILKSTSIKDFFPEEHVQRIISYGEVSLVLVKHEKQSDEREYSEGSTLSDVQRKILLSAEYSTSFNIRAVCKHHNPETGIIENSVYNPHFTIVPEKQAEYINGKETLLNYLKENSKKEKEVAHSQEKLRPAKIYFTVTKNGKITNVILGNHSGYKIIDTKMIELISNIPGKWQPAENVKGEKVDQELVVSYGLEGC
jgi:hypothetical protein